MQPDWEQFKAHTKEQITLYLKSAENKPQARHLLMDLFDKDPESEYDVSATLHLIHSTPNKRDAAVVGMMAYLWMYEVDYVRCLDAFCYLLISNGHDLFHSLRNKYVKSLDDIGRVDVYTKLNFLEEHSFGLLKRPEDMALRNKIAHHAFVIDHSGKVFIAKKEVEVGEKFNNLVGFQHQVFLAYCSGLGIDV